MATQSQLLGIYAGTLVCHGLLNTFANRWLVAGWARGQRKAMHATALAKPVVWPIAHSRGPLMPRPAGHAQLLLPPSSRQAPAPTLRRLLAILNGISVFWHVVGTFVFIVALLAVAPTHQSASYVFGHFNKPGRCGAPALLTGLWGCLPGWLLPLCSATRLAALLPLPERPVIDVASLLLPSPMRADVGIASSGLIFLLGLLMSQFTLTGYDASAHMTEETKDAAKSGPRGIVMTVVVSFFVGWLYLLALTFSIQVRPRCRQAAGQGALAGAQQAPAVCDAGSQSALCLPPPCCRRTPTTCSTPLAPPGAPTHLPRLSGTPLPPGEASVTALGSSMPVVAAWGLWARRTHPLTGQ